MADLEMVPTDLYPPDGCALDVEPTRPIAPTQHNARVAQSPASGRPLPWLDVSVVLLYALIVPFAVYLAIALVSAHVLVVLSVGVATAFAVTGLVVTLEAAVALPRKYVTGPTQALGKESALTARVPADAPAGRFVRPAGVSASPDERPLPAVTALVVAYLPNEQDIILETLHHLLAELDVPEGKLQVILAYNTPHILPVEHDLRVLAARDPRLLVLRMDGSSSKAENVNRALARATGEITAIFDADHHPEPRCFRKAVRWFHAGYDAVQGRCIIRNNRETWLTRMISVEFGTMYAVSHTSRSLQVDTAIFGGSNGYWKTTVLRSLSMDRSMLTEDIDVSIRALLAGCRILHDRSIISTELAPTTVSSWFYQRLRWAQGWYQVTRKYSWAVATSPCLTRRQKLYWAYMLSWREAFAAIALQSLPLLWAMIVVHLRRGGTWEWDSYLSATTLLTLSSGVVTAVAAYKHRTAAQPSITWHDTVLYIVFSPLLALVRNIITLVSWMREARRQHEWIATARGRGAVSPKPPVPPTSTHESSRRDSIAPIPAQDDRPISALSLHIRS
jgi:cellulose synthase/poly-beta-1,6-N-acetylglucosamine synthase-like glycosyltransferase